MKLFSAAFLALASAQDDGADRWSFYDYDINAGGKMGHAVSGIGVTNAGGHEGNRRFCHSTLDTETIYKWDNSKNGYFGHFNKVECLGEELFCFIEERAHFGQVIGIRAGCAQMMNHPQVPTFAPPGTINDQLKNSYLKEASEGAAFQQGSNSVNIYYGIGGCLALPAQNGEVPLDSGFNDRLTNNYWLPTHSGYGMNQCLRFQESNAATDLLPFGVSVCRACCLAFGSVYDASDTSNGLVGKGPCNFWPLGASGNPTTYDAGTFGCTAASNGSCTASNGGGSNCNKCSKQMFPNFSMLNQPDFTTYRNLFMTGTNAFCDAAGACTPAVVHLSKQPFAGGR